ncbi:MAG TPA: lipase maturation factor family protein [Acidobacteriaceae bacterium]
MDTARRVFVYLFDSEHGARDYLIARWVFLRALGLIYFSAFLALVFQARGLIGAHGILPASELLSDARSTGAMRFWAVPSLLWTSSSDHMLMALMVVGLVASVLLVASVWPRGMLLLCFLCFLSFVSAAQDFSGYQSDGMLLEAGFLSLFLAPPGLWPRWGPTSPPRRAAILLLLWEWFRIYFESGAVKLLSGDPTWRNLTAMYEYYQNGPLPTWIGWYVQHLPLWFHRATAGLTLAMELVLVWMAFLPRRWRITCCLIVTAWQIGVIATANYAFLNYLVLALAVLLLDDAFLRRFVPTRWRIGLDAARPADTVALHAEDAMVRLDLSGSAEVPVAPREVREFRWLGIVHSVSASVAAVALTWVFYATSVLLLRMFWQEQPFPTAPVAVLGPFRIANQYGLFAVMTPHRYEIEFQGSNDGQTWVAYPFRHKPQDVHERPGIYAPYQPRFDWNLWFASLGSWMQNPIVPRTEELLLENDRDVMGLFADDPFRGTPPKFVRAVIWQYWFSTPEEKRRDGVWWTRQSLGTYAPTLTKAGDGRFAVVAKPTRDVEPEP